MFRKIKAYFSGPSSPVIILVLSALGVVIFIAVAGMLVYGNTRRMISSEERLEHSQEVMNTLERATDLADRIDAAARLYLSTKNDDDLDIARETADQLDATVAHLQGLVADNPGQAGYADTLDNCASGLNQLLDGLNPASAAPSVQVQHCQKTISLMVEQEQRLLKERSQTSQRSSTVSIAGQAAFGGLAMLVLLIMFGFLLRDAVLRQRVSTQTRQTNLQLEQSVGQLEDRAEEAEVLTVCRDELQLCLDVAQVFKSAAKSVNRLLPKTKGSLCMINSSRNMVEVVARWGETNVDDFTPPEACCGLRSGYPRWREPGGSEIDCTHFGEAGAPERYLCLPIVAHGNGLGIVYIECADAAMAESVKRRLDGVRQFTQLMGMTVATLNLQVKLENQSIRDALTGLFNRHFMQVAFDRELSRAVRRNDTLAVFMLDVDHFKKFNDTYGHAAGDAVLRSIAEVFRNCVRAEDVVCRYGGEEFTIILPDITVANAYERAEGIRRAVEHLSVPIERGAPCNVTISIGVAIFPSDGRVSEDLLRQADQALYRAKRQGRNQVSLSELTASDRREEQQKL